MDRSGYEQSGEKLKMKTEKGIFVNYGDAKMILDGLSHHIDSEQVRCYVILVLYSSCYCYSLLLFYL